MNYVILGVGTIGLIALIGSFLGVGWALILAIPAFILVLIVFAKIANAVGYQAPNIRAAAEKRRLEATTAVEAAARLAAEIATKKEAALAQLSGWKPITFGRILNLPHLPHCIMAMGAAGHLIRVLEYDEKGTFEVTADYTINVRNIISLNIAAPTVKKTIFTNQAVSIISKEDRSPVARGLIGGALLGPTGLVLGAASGLNGKLSTTVEERKVQQEVDGLGEPQLIMGLKDIERPVLKIQFEPSSLADEWMFRIRAAQQGAN